MKTSATYIQDMRRAKRRLFVLGERVETITEHPLLRPSLNALGRTYDIAHEPGHAPLFVREGIDGGEVNLFTSLHRSPQDLVDKVKALRLLGQETGTCFQRCVGWDALNSLESTTFEMDRANSTQYHERFMTFLRHVQVNDLVCNGAMTDVKGDRSLRPGQQKDPDLYLRVIERRPDGIVVRGAKAHQTGAVFAHEIIVMPTLALHEEEKDYAVSFAIPSDTQGIIHIMGRQASDTRKLEGGRLDVGNPGFGGHEALVIFEDVFVPYERIFMDGEWQFSGMLVERFAGYHRQSYGGCKTGVGDVLIGAAASAAEYAGVERASHVQHKLAEMVHLNETMYACGIACSAGGCQLASGTYLVDQLLANVCKQNVTRMPYEIARLAEDLAGGLMVTLPSERDLRNEETGPLLDKYLRGIESASTLDRLRILRLIENLTIGAGAVAYRTESLHGAGSPETQVVMIRRLCDLERKKALARRLAGIGSDTGGL
jgi:4-hydroxybutyryl-CoA dehydratase / vinylacetyl-CoA-Delta-isomerase